MATANSGLKDDLENQQVGNPDCMRSRNARDRIINILY